MGRWEHTHQALQEAALTLFTEHGYDDVSTARVARRAGVSEMTLFRHFPTKAALVLQDPFDPVIADAVRARPVGEAPMRAVSEAVRQAWHQISPAQARTLRTRLAIIAGAESLRGKLETNVTTTEAIIRALTDRGVLPAAASVAGTAVISGLHVALLEWARSPDDGDLHTALDVALDVLGGS